MRRPRPKKLKTSKLLLRCGLLSICVCMVILVLANINTMLYGAEELELASVKNKYEEQIRALEREKRGDQNLRGIQEEEDSSSSSSETVVKKEPDMPTMPDDPSQEKTFIALLVICYNRPQYLRNLLNNIRQNLPEGDPLDIFISQDGQRRDVAGEIQLFQKEVLESRPDAEVNHLQHQQEHRGDDDRHGYQKLSRHFGWAIEQVFQKGYKHVIILEEDLEISVDFFPYFYAMAEILDNDETLLAVSAYNDIGQPQFVSDPKFAVRSDFFPGLGWMIPRRIWDEIGPKWPAGYWDDWMREPHVRKDRAIIRPEVSRTRTIGKVGVSGSQYFDKYLGNIKLNDEPVDWLYLDIDYLLKDTFDADFHALIASATDMKLDELFSQECRDHHPEEDKLLKTPYKLEAKEKGPYPDWKKVATTFGFIDDIKAGVPRTAYQGVVRISHKGCTKLFYPHDWDPEQYRQAGG
eukprot:gb/GECG01005217.1/.p1 GENE.gb/GECG01005217.1/~~gb/GECG01005217.1/.p1  ORF type:complete len:464 (+),score=65.51 gb/GECG01005217.1/:1-1392(+)